MEIREIQSQVLATPQDQEDVNDWIHLFGRRTFPHQTPCSCGYVLIQLNDHGEYEGVAEAADVELDGCRCAGHHPSMNRPAVQFDDEAAIAEISAEMTDSVVAAAALRHRHRPMLPALNLISHDGDRVAHIEDASDDTYLHDRTQTSSNSFALTNVEHQSTEPQAINGAPSSSDPLSKVLRKGLYATCMDAIISLTFTLSLNYTDLYATESQQELIEGGRRETDSKLWTLLRGIFYTISSHTTIIAFLAVFANQVSHGNILSTIPALAVLLVGMCQRPYPHKVTPTCDSTNFPSGFLAFSHRLHRTDHFHQIFLPIFDLVL